MIDVSGVWCQKNREHQGNSIDHLPLPGSIIAPRLNTIMTPIQFLYLSLSMASFTAAQPAAAPVLPNPEDKTHEPVLGYPSTGAPNWWSKFYLPLDSGGSSKVPMPDGLMIAQSQALRTAHKSIPWEDAETLQSPDTDNAEDNEKGTFKPGTDDEYLAARAEGTTSSQVESTEENKDPDAEELTDEERAEEDRLKNDPEHQHEEALESDAKAYKLR
jgi:hypothetical protein